MNTSSDSFILRAAQFATKAHQGQVRKFNEVPYICHPARVAGRVAAHQLASPNLVAAAFLHDVVEDTDVTLDIIESAFNKIVACFVSDLTSPYVHIKPRGERKQKEQVYYSNASESAKIVKLLDRIDNLCDLSRAPSHYIHRYCLESLDLVSVIGAADQLLAKELTDKVRSLLGDHFPTAQLD